VSCPALLFWIIFRMLDPIIPIIDEKSFSSLLFDIKTTYCNNKIFFYRCLCFFVRLKKKKKYTRQQKECTNISSAIKNKLGIKDYIYVYRSECDFLMSISKCISGLTNTRSHGHRKTLNKHEQQAFIEQYVFPTSSRHDLFLLVMFQ
jgi:hypothetical protein